MFFLKDEMKATFHFLANLFSRQNLLVTTLKPLTKKCGGRNIPIDQRGEYKRQKSRKGRYIRQWLITLSRSVWLKRGKIYWHRYKKWFYLDYAYCEMQRLYTLNGFFKLLIYFHFFALHANASKLSFRNIF